MSDIGHNKPPLSDYLDVDIILDQLAIDHAEVFARHYELMAGYGKFIMEYENGGIPNDDVARNAVDFAKQLKLEAKRVDEIREKVKKPYLEAGRGIDSLFKVRLIDFQINAAKHIEQKLAIYQTTKAQIARQEAARLANERKEEIARRLDLNDLEGAVEAADEAIEAERSVEASVTEISRVRGDRGGLATIQEETSFEVEDLAKVPLEYFILDEAKVKKVVRAGISIPGIKTTTIYKTVVR